MRSFRAIALCAVASMFALGAAQAGAQPGPQAYPTKPIRLVIAFPPGGTSDFVGRVVAAKLSEYLGQPIVIDNRPGAGSLNGTETVAKAMPDGYTLLAVAASFSITIGWPRNWDILSAMTRPTKSDVPPGGNAMTRRTGFVG